MTKYPIKMLLDEKKNPFFPVVTTDSVLVNGTEQTAADLFADRYTKAEIDKIIADLGTLQRFCGKVDSIASLPNNAKPGDTYIVTDVSGNNSEYMYIGDKWEELGPMVDLSGYDTSEEINAKLSALKDNVNGTAEANSAEALKQAKQYTDTRAAALATDALTDAKAYTDEVIAQSGTVDLSNYYNKAQSDARAEAIANEKITAIPVNNLLHFKGHVNSKEDLPTAGQVSGEIIDRKTVINSKKYNAFQNPSEDIKTNIRNNKKEGYNYFIGTQYGALNTNFPEIIEGVTIFNQWNDTYYLNMIVRVNASTSKPCVWVSGYPKTPALMKNGLFDDGTPVQASFGELLIMQPAWIVMTDTYTSSLYVLGNIPEPIKYKYTDIEQMPFATNMSDSPSSQMIRYTNIKSIVTDGFVYNPGYKLFGFNDDETPYWITTTGSDINENDVYTVGPNYDLVRGNAVEQKWEPLAPKSIEIDNNTITLSSENKIQTRAIIDKNTNNANSFWTGTKAEYDALGVYDENTFYAITDEASTILSALTEVSGYDAAKTQILKNINGTLTWVDSQ